jgi:nicotinamide mononucleotide transporter
VVRSSARLLVILSLVTVAATTLLTIYLRSINDAAPLLDAFTTVLSLIAQGMLARKLIENWPAWIVVNIISIAMYVYKNLYLTALLSVVFTAMCILGYLRWSRQLHESSREETSVLV